MSPVTKKKISAQNFTRPGVRKKHPRVKLAKVKFKQRGIFIAGFDTSMSSIAGAAISFDNTARQWKGPVFVMKRWDSQYDYFSRLRDAARGHELVQDLIGKMLVTMELDDIFICQEEPFPPHGAFTGRGQSATLKQQAEISGAFLGSLIRWGYKNIQQIGNHQWRQVVAADLGITIHHSKWRDPELCAFFNCKPADSGKFRAKQWAMQLDMEEVIPEWPDIINSSKGKIPRPEGSRAKGIQCDDRYEALAMMEFQRRELDSAGLLAKYP